MSYQPPRPGSKAPRGDHRGRCTHHNPYNLVNLGARCVMGNKVDGHELAATTGNALGLPMLIHRDPDGLEWTEKGPFKREVRPDVADMG